MSWSNWVQTVHTQPENVPSLLDRRLELSPMGDSAQEKAIIQAMQNREGHLFFLEGQDEGEELIVYQHRGEWFTRRWDGQMERENLALFLDYSSDLAEFVVNQKGSKELGDYYSLRPLIYGGDYWLEKICGDEVNRFSDLGEDRHLAVILISWESGDSLFDFVESLRRGDRIGYFDNMLGVLLPFTNPTEASQVHDRLKSRFTAEDFEIWHWNREFENHFELKNRVEKYL